MMAQRYLQRTVNKVLVLVGDGPESLESLRYAANLASLCDASALLLYHAKVPVPHPAGIGHLGCFSYPVFGKMLSELEDHAKGVLEKAVSVFDYCRVVCTTKVLMSMNPTANAICQFARDEKCDLIVIGDAKTEEHHGLFHDSTAANIVKKAPCPVVVVK